MASRSEDGVDVRLGGGAGCEGCGHCSSLAEGEMLMCGVADPIGVDVGDEVEVEIPQGARLAASAIAYGSPILGLFAGYLAGFLLGTAVGWDPDATGALLAVLAVVSLFLAARRWGAGLFMSERFRPRVRARITRSEQTAGEGRDGG